MKNTSSVSRAVARLRLRAATEIGKNARTFGAPFVRNRGVLVVGDDFSIASSPVQSHLVVERGARLVIGRGVVIGSGAAVSCASEIAIGDGVHVGRGVLVMDSDFHDAEAMGSPGASAPISIGAGAFLGDRVVVLKGAVVGAGARIGQDSVVSGVVPPGAFATGVPARTRRESAASSADLEERVHAIVAETFEVARALEPGDGPSTLARWDSLGALRLLLALEEDFGLRLAEDALARVTNVGALVELVAAALDSGRRAVDAT